MEYIMRRQDEVLTWERIRGVYSKLDLCKNKVSRKLKANWLLSWKSMQDHYCNKSDGRRLMVG